MASTTTADLSGKTVVITGGNAGIGKEAAVELASRGADVIITARNPAKGEAALTDIRARATAGSVELASLDLASFASVRACAADLLARTSRIDVLLNNAGGMLSERWETEEGYELTFGGNHLGHFLLTNELLDRLVDSRARIVNTSSIGHRMALTGLSWNDLAHRTGGYNGTQVYAESKLANLLHANALAARLAGTGVTANACHPGPVRTGFGSADDTTGFERFGMAIARPFLITAASGARPLVHLAASPAVEGATGGYYVGGYVPGVQQHRPSRHGRDPEAAARLWELSEQLVAAADARRAPGSDPTPHDATPAEPEGDR